MKRHFSILSIWAIALAGFLIAQFNFHLGIIGIAIVFFALAFVPGFLVFNLFERSDFSFLDIYLLSLVLGLSIFMVIGVPVFLIKASLKVVILLIFILNSCLLLLNFIFMSKRKVETREREAEPIIVYLLVGLFTVVALVLGSFRGWGEDWDYYTYITMVRRLVSRGIIDNYPCAYANEIADPIHGFNVWALLWATVAKGASVDPIFLYVNSAFLTVPACLCAFYFAGKALFSKSVARASLFCYAVFHLFGMGMILLGRSSFYTDDPSWLIFFPTLLGTAIRFVDDGRKSWLVLLALFGAGIWLLHPLWGMLTFISLGLGVVGNLFVKTPISKADKMAVGTGLIIFFFPVVYAFFRLLEAGVPDFELPSPKGSVLFLGVPLILFSPWLYKKLRASYRDTIFRRIFLAIVSLMVALPFVILRFYLISKASGDAVLSSPYKFFVSGALFVLSPFNFTYTAPDMTLFPFSLLGLFAIPLLIKMRNENRWKADFTLLGLFVIPLIALHPYLAYWFSKWAHIAYLRRALRLSAMFASLSAGLVVAWLAGKFALRKRALVEVIVFLVLACAVWAYPYSPPYFQRAFDKAVFVISNSPSQGLFWHPEYDIYKRRHASWDTERFDEILSSVNNGDTIFSDRFTSYRLTAYRDVYVVCRFKPSQSVRDQMKREEDQARFFAEKNNEGRCQILKKYDARWVLLNLDSDYRVRDYYLGDPWTARELEADKERFSVVKRVDNWILFRAESACW